MKILSNYYLATSTFVTFTYIHPFIPNIYFNYSIFYSQSCLILDIEHVSLLLYYYYLLVY